MSHNNGSGTVGCALALLVVAISYSIFEATLYIRALWNLGGIQ